MPLPAPAQPAPLMPRQLQVTPVRPASKVSVTVAPVTGDGPALLTTSAYWIRPWPISPRLLVLLIDRSALAPPVPDSVKLPLPGAFAVTLIVCSAAPEAAGVKV